MNFTFSELFCLFGGFLGLVLLIIILVKLKGSVNTKISLAFFLFLGFSVITIGTITFSGNIVHFPHLFRLDSPLHYLFGPVCFYYTLASFKNDFKFRPVQLLNLLPFLLNLIEFTPFYFSSAESKLQNYNTLYASGSLILPMHAVLKAISALAYLILQIYFFSKYRPLRSVRTASQKHLVSWFCLFYGGQVFMLVGLFLNIFAKFSLFHDPYRFTILVESIFLYSATIALLFYPEILYGNRPLEKGIESISNEKYVNSKLSEHEKTEILGRLKHFLNQETRPYLNPKIKLSDVANSLGISSQNLSQVINEKSGLNFNDYINVYRVELAKTLLASPDYYKNTIDAIAEKAGFNSKSPFYIAFKKHTGVTPKEFIGTLRIEK